MNPINLLPFVERQPKWSIDKLIFIFSMLLVLIYSSIYTYNEFKIFKIEKELQAIGNQYELLQPTLEIMQKSNDKLQLIDTKNKIAALLTNERHPLYTLIQRIVAIMPQQLWFTNLSKSDNGLLEMKGAATTYSVVAEFIENMEKDTFFLDPTLVKVEFDTAASLLIFEITVKSKGM
ncbi:MULTISPECIES: PilN domain-containing protein [Pelosinus]|uniref:Fimbrial assembly family protein n=1 Tax=Pelosinus fermentans B4 TaxID=1149862 RepID=I8RJD4_9FIRM|nr:MULTISPECIES: PilN domain-containing protein [Pelosinus]EIW18280.1 Fimbrial assembly family protein [Pelosinus fermentans B4]EIW24266.1 Fimbrial assembly family protein [Pelosinus fermentans A11]OAM94288.1 Fimbrial assembly family protein [Pelosinus fermentans DSM 17108]SDR05232.1 type IV pilus assembly protein PilN [Pelosinus fermentans]